MKMTLMITTSIPEVIWNGFRMANLMLGEDHEVTVFLNGPSVNYESMDSDAYPLTQLAKVFTLSEGVLLAWGKLMDLHGLEEGFHKRAKQMDLYNLIINSDTVLTF